MRTDLICEQFGVEKIHPIHFVHLFVLELGQGALGEIHDAVERVGHSEKFIVVLLRKALSLCVHLSTTADLAILTMIVAVVKNDN